MSDEAYEATPTPIGIETGWSVWDDVVLVWQLLHQATLGSRHEAAVSRTADLPDGRELCVVGR
jgi:hypothetical protein